MTCKVGIHLLQFAKRRQISNGNNLSKSLSVKDLPLVFETVHHTIHRIPTTTKRASVDRGKQKQWDELRSGTAGTSLDEPSIPRKEHIVVARSKLRRLAKMHPELHLRIHCKASEMWKQGV